jgi:TolB protein
MHPTIDNSIAAFRLTRRHAESEILNIKPATIRHAFFVIAGSALVATGIIVVAQLASNELRRRNAADAAPAISASDSVNALAQTFSADSKTGVGGNAEVKTVSFSRDGSVYVRDLRTGQEKLALEKRVFGFWSEGCEMRLNYYHSMSPNGEAIAYGYSSAAFAGDSTIKVRNLVSGVVREFPELQGTSSYKPVWSHDGKQIAFTISKGWISHVGILDVASGKWRDITTAPELEDQEMGVEFDSWMPDDKSIVCHSSRFLYRLALDGSIVLKFPLDSFDVGDSSPGGARFSFTADGKRLLFDPVHPDDAALFIYDFETKSLSRVTPETLGAGEPLWLPGEKEILFTCSDPDQRLTVPNICKIGADGSGLKILIENAGFASYSTN